jgi:hypothetical protein
VLTIYTSFADRDILMRHHWGLAVGHVYSHHRQCTHAGLLWPARNNTSQHLSDSDIMPSTRSLDNPHHPTEDELSDVTQDPRNSEVSPGTSSLAEQLESGPDPADGDTSSCSGSGSDDEWDNEEGYESDGLEESDEENSSSDERELLEFEEMYGNRDVESGYED